MKHFHDIPVLTTNILTNPVVYTFKIDKGLIMWAGVFFPDGCNGVIHAKIFFQDHQILPRNQEAWCSGNDGWWQGELYFPVTAAPMTVKVILYSYNHRRNEAAIYDHTVTIGLELMPWNQVPSWERLILTLERIGRVFGIQPVEMPVTEMTP